MDVQYAPGTKPLTRDITAPAGFARDKQDLPPSTGNLQPRLDPVHRHETADPLDVFVFEKQPFGSGFRGHDGQTAMLLGAARLLAEEGGFNGTVQFIFHPAEDWGKGALSMMADGLFERFSLR